MSNTGVMVHCEIADGKLAPIATELLGAGSRLAEDLGQELSAVLIGSNIAALAQEAIAYGAKKVYVVDDPLLKDYLDRFLSDGYGESYQTSHASDFLTGANSNRT